jgi:hypothetical protein
VLHGLLADVFCHDEFYVAEPLVGIKAVGLRLFTQANDAVRASVVSSKGEKSLVYLVDAGIVEISLGELLFRAAIGVAA